MDNKLKGNLKITGELALQMDSSQCTMFNKGGRHEFSIDEGDKERLESCDSIVVSIQMNNPSLYAHTSTVNKFV